MKHDKAIKILSNEIYRLGGVVFARYLATQNPETLKTVEASEFLGSLMSGKIPKKTEEYLKPYLEPMWEINSAIKTLESDK